MCLMVAVEVDTCCSRTACLRMWTVDNQHSVRVDHHGNVLHVSSIVEVAISLFDHGYDSGNDR